MRLRGRNSSHVSTMRKSDQRLNAFAENAEKTARRQRDIQKKVDRAGFPARNRHDELFQAWSSFSRSSGLSICSASLTQFRA